MPKTEHANFANRTVWTGDNLDVMRGLNSESIDLVYVDGPFNSNRNYAAPVGSKAAGAAFKDTFHHGYVTARTDIPKRTDIDVPVPYRNNKHVLFGQQEGLCGGCKVMFLFRNFTIDHIIPQSRGGTDHLDNLQLLCGACNSLKGDRHQEYLMARLNEG